MDSASQGWTLIARFSNYDAKNWMEDTGDWWYDKNTADGETTDPSSNTDMISPAFWLVSGNEFKITRSDDSQHAALLHTTGDCLGGQTFRSMITSYGNFRNGGQWEVDGCLGSCTVQYGGQYETTKGFSWVNCDGDLQSRDEIGFWCEGKWDGSVMTIGGGGMPGETECGKMYHGVGITSATYSSFVQGNNRYEVDFGDFPENPSGFTPDYSLNFWIR